MGMSTSTSASGGKIWLPHMAVLTLRRRRNHTGKTECTTAKMK